MKADVIGVCSNRPELLVPYAGSPARPSDQPKGPEIVCHRGINKLAPENTMKAAKLVFEQGFDWLELDVQQTEDNQLVVIHDDTLERTTNGTGPVAARTLADLRQLDAGGWVSTLHAGEQIPRLAEMIDLAKDWNKRIYIELKKADPRLVLDLVRELRISSMIASSGALTGHRVETLRALEPRANIMVRTQDHSSIDALFDATAPDIVEITINEANQDKIDQIRARGAKAMICYMGEDMAVMERILSLAPDMVNLDNPHVWKELLHRRRLVRQRKDPECMKTDEDKSGPVTSIDVARKAGRFPLCCLADLHTRSERGARNP